MISLVIPTFNRLMKLFRLLKSLNILKPKPYDIIIIDDNSTDQTPELLRDRGKEPMDLRKKLYSSPKIKVQRIREILELKGHITI